MMVLLQSLFTRTLGLLAVTVLAATAALAASPPAIHYQGLLLDVNGESLNSDTNIEVRVWSHATSFDPADQLYEEVHLDTPVVDGVFGIVLGSGSFASTPPFDADTFSGANAWLELTVAGELLSPRQPFLSVAYALRSAVADEAETIGGMSPEDILPVGSTLSCTRNDKMTGIDGTTGDVFCATDQDAYNSAFDTEAEIDAAVANNGYSVGPHSIDTNAQTLCPSGSFLNGDGTCDQGDASGDCGGGQVCTGGHLHSVYNSASNLSSGTLNVNRYDAYSELTAAGRLDNNHSTDLLTRGQLDGRFVNESSGNAFITGNYTHNTRTGYIHVTPASLIPMDESYDYYKSGYVRPEGGDTVFIGVAAIDPPDGATITRITGYYYDNDSSGGAASFDCGVESRLLTASNTTTIVNMPTTVNWVPSAAPRAVSSSPAVSHQVDKSTRSYEATAYISDTRGLTTFRHYGCRVEYTYENSNH